MSGSVQRPGVRRTGQSARGHAYCQHGCDAARLRRSGRRPPRPNVTFR